MIWSAGCVGCSSPSTGIKPARYAWVAAVHGEARRRAGLITADQFNGTVLPTAFRYVQFVLRARPFVSENPQSQLHISYESTFGEKCGAQHFLPKGDLFNMLSSIAGAAVRAGYLLVLSST